MIYCKVINTSDSNSSLITESLKRERVKPIIHIFNQTYHVDFIFNNDIVYKEKVCQDSIWCLKLDSKSLFDLDTDRGNRQLWKIQIEMDTSEFGTLKRFFTLFDNNSFALSMLPKLLSLEVPIVMYNDSNNDAEILIMRHSCIANVAILSLKHITPQKFLYFTIMFDGFTKPILRWSRANTKKVCLYIGHFCENLKIIDGVFTNHYVVLLTDHGIIITPDLEKLLSDKTRAKVRRTNAMDMLNVFFLSKCPSCNLITSGSVNSPTICMSLYNHHYDDIVIVKYVCENKVSRILISTHDLQTWTFLDEFEQESDADILLNDAVYNSHINAMVLLYSNKDNSATVKVKHLDFKNKTSSLVYTPYEFESSFQITSLVIHPISSLIYAFGRKLFVSYDSGNSFILLYISPTTPITNIYVGSMNGDCIGVHKDNPASLVYSKPGVDRVAEFNLPSHLTKCSVYINSLDEIYCVWYRAGIVSSEKLDVKTLLENFKVIHHHVLAVQYISPRKLIAYEHTPRAKRGYFRKFIIGMNIARSNLAGNGIITKHLNRHSCGNFNSCIEVTISHSFETCNISESPALLCNIHILKMNKNGEIIIKLIDDDNQKCVAGYWRSHDVYKTIIVPSLPSHLIIRIIDDTSVQVLSTLKDTKYYENTTIKYGMWHLINFGMTKNKSICYYNEPKCLHSLSFDKASHEKMIFELDVGEKLVFSNLITVTDDYMQTEDAFQFFTLSNRWIFQVSTTSTVLSRPHREHNITIHISSILRVRTISVIRVHVPMSSLLCLNCNHLRTIVAYCPTAKKLNHIFHGVNDSTNMLEDKSMIINEEGFEMFFKLPINYQPPSNEGVGIPLIDHIYNADPTKLLSSSMNNRSWQRGIFKQCKNMKSSNCSCTQKMRISNKIKYSDCIQYVYSLFYPGEFKTNFTLSQLGREDRRMLPNELIYISELNNRTFFIRELDSKISVVNDATRNNSRSKNKYHNHNITIFMKGSGLYHFKVSVLQSCSFCDLSTEIMVYVDKAPLPYPSHYIINFGIHLLCGICLLWGYIYVVHLNEDYYKFPGIKANTNKSESLARCAIHTPDKIQRIIQRNLNRKINPN